MQHLSKQAKKRFKHSQYENSAILNNGQNSIKNTFRYRFVQTGSYCFAKHTFQRSVETDILQENLNNLMNFFVRKNQIKEVATTSRSDKRSRTEEELQAVNAFLYKRPKIIATQYIY
ncbi:uncharacterized protein LOC105194769 isoform X1 [Solenopsis invicta]|uniref:uncharacterized protein LOC105194769 isoform X1 n=1 Tax=Solenopsis invicta TaxID=13686 RepID=UPI00193EACD0|nr:uncharacterized protein LOC105194769 isoform X1 [Solenopsis invicta]